MARPKEKTKQKIRQQFQKTAIPLSKKNLIILTIGVITIVLGFFIMAIGGTESPLSLTIAPIILIVSYLIIIPYAILKKFKE